ncbi:hypothetical protein [Streptomyces sp. V1I1]|uniref:hypothetical protein n=1 Tax=Streptomyces sp. V1I1 TaxID=3042272 RepID=UPI0027D7834C|nr:hypothetical protein [Streptomyces sp. V1I1]
MGGEVDGGGTAGVAVVSGFGRVEASVAIRQLRPAAHHAAEPAFRSADILTGGLTAGTLKPPEGPGKAAG